MSWILPGFGTVAKKLFENINGHLEPWFWQSTTACLTLVSLCFCRVMQDMENPQVTSCNKGDQHYRSSPSNQSSSSDPGPCGSGTWSQQPGYDGYGTTAVLLISNSPKVPFFAAMNAATISHRQHYFWELAISQNGSNFATWNDRIISLLLASCDLFFVGSDVEKLHWEPRIREDDGGWGVLYMRLLCLPLNQPRALLSGLQPEEHKGSLKT